MKSKSLFFLFSILLSLVGTTAFAYDIEVKNAEGVTIYYNYINDGKEFEVTNNYTQCYSGVVIIPEEVTYMNRTRKVTSIGDGAFEACIKLTSVTIPNSVTNIGAYAFARCNMQSVIIPNSVTTIGKYAFYNNFMTSITVPNSVTRLGESVFSSCTSLTSATIGNGVTSIESHSFSQCYNLASIKISNCVTNIGDYAFADCYRLTSIEITNNETIRYGAFWIPNSITSIGEGAFQDCNGLAQGGLIIPSSVKSIGDRAFAGVDIPWVSSYIENPFDISTNTFSKNTFYNASLTVPKGAIDKYKVAEGWKQFLYINGTLGCDIAVKNADGVTIYYNYINDGTELEVTNRDIYYNCYSGSLAIPEKVTYMNRTRKVTSIGEGAFQDCSSLTSVTIPGSVTSIGYYAFYYCSGLTSVIIPGSVTSIGERTFSGCSSLTSVTIPGSVTSIGEFAFSGCSGLTSVTISGGVTSIGRDAFYGCSGLISITIPGSVTSIGVGAFNGCSGLTSVTIPSNVSSIGEYAFSNCSGLTSISVESGNTKYDSRDNCNGIIETGTNALIIGCQKTTFPNSVTSIGVGAFSGCSGLTSVTIPGRITSIGEFAFSNCSGLTSISVESGNTKYDSRDNCNGIIEKENNKLIIGCQKTKIPNSVTSIGEFAFSGCSGLTSVTIPGSVTSIGGSAFYECIGLTSVTIGDGVSIIGHSAFANCIGLTSVTIPNSVTYIDGMAFYNCNLSEVISKIENPFKLVTYQPTFSDYTFSNATLYVPKGTVYKYKNTNGWCNFNSIIEGTPLNTTAVKSDGKNILKRFTMDGRFIMSSKKGINIIRMNDGTTIKVLVK